MPEPTLGWKPVVAVWELTRADVRYRHCRPSLSDPSELTTAEALALLDQLRDLDPRALVLTGVEPTERPHLYDLVTEAVARGLRVEIAPRVTPFLTAQAIGRFSALGVGRIALGLDGSHAGLHDQLRGTPGSFAATCAAIAAVRAAGLPLEINTSVTRDTLHALPHTADLVAEIAPEVWSVFFMVPVRRAQAEQELGPRACERAFHFLRSWSEDTGLAVETPGAPAYRRVVLQGKGARGEPGRRRARAPVVNDGKGALFVSHTGDVYPSGFLPLAAGNVRETPVARLYRAHPLFRILRDESRLQGKCGMCAFRGVCGGSRARAFARTGNLLAEDPACAYEPTRTEA